MSGNEKRFDKALVIFVDILGSQSRDDFNELLRLPIPEMGFAP